MTEREASYTVAGAGRASPVLMPGWDCRCARCGHEWVSRCACPTVDGGSLAIGPHSRGGLWSAGQVPELQRPELVASGWTSRPGGAESTAAGGNRAKGWAGCGAGYGGEACEGAACGYWAAGREVGL